jgi:hypothetical protein
MLGMRYLVAHVSTFLDEAPLPLVVSAVESGCPKGASSHLGMRIPLRRGRLGVADEPELNLWAAGRKDRISDLSIDVKEHASCF